MTRKLIKVLFAAALVGVVGAAGYWQWSGHRKLNAGVEVFVISPGQGVSTIARNLVSENVIEEPYSFVLWSYRRGLTGSLKAGEYAFDPDLTLIGLLEKFARGDVISYSITFVEGWTFKQYRERLDSHPKIRHTLGGLSDMEIMSRLGHPKLYPEGRFFPDTYQFTAGVADLDILRWAFESMDELLQREWSQRAPGVQLSSMDEALTLASIIEKETARPEERAEISAVFHNRLAKNMRLQTDPTVIYGLGGAFTGNLKRVHLRRDTPYNTYTRHGLPPTPIANPGAEAVRAALNPAGSNALYFVARGDGSHQFSNTLSDHNAAVVRYQLRGAKVPPTSSDPGE